MRESVILRPLGFLATAGTAVSVWIGAVDVLKEWVTPLTAIVVGHLGALGVLVVVVRCHVERSSLPTDGEPR